MSLTPMMQQYLQTKEQVPGALLLFRMGDFYELFFEDAETAARVLGLTLTSRDKGTNPIPMAGFPYHALDGYLQKLLGTGMRVAICEQVEDPKTAVGLVKREITRIVTPGTLTDDSLLDPRRSNYLVAIAPPSGRQTMAGLAWADLSTGQMTVTELEVGKLGEELARLEPKECLIPESVDRVELLGPAESIPLTWTTRPPWTFAVRNAKDLLSQHFSVQTFAGFGVDDDSEGIRAAGALLNYLQETQKTNLQHVSRLIPYRQAGVMLLDPATRRSLELVRTLRDNRRDGTLLDTIDRTVTACGARCLADWLSQPLLDSEAIRYRQSAVAEWKEDPMSRQHLRDALRQTYDVERLVSRISTGRTNPRDLSALRETLRALPPIKARLVGRNAQFNADHETDLNLFPELRERLEKTLVDEPPFTVREGGMIRDGFHPELDELRDIAVGGKHWMVEFQQREAERTGISNLKIGFNKVFGYYVEIPNSGRDKAPADYTRKQTVKNAERYITPELKEYEHKVLGAEERARTLEYEIFRELREEVAQHTVSLQNVARLLSRLDVVLALAELAAARGYVRPTIEDSGELVFESGRHPVLDITLDAGRFVPNDTRLAEGKRFVLITGPNMAGKSTYIRQVALLTLMAQMGSFIPAASARVGIVDRIFTRVGASDELSRGQSTFMVEMTETANILNNATDRSLVILDEIGRGTSTYDGVSLAWAIAEHLHERTRCRTLFATHYHELIQLESELDGLRNQNVAVREWKDEIIFLHQIVDGGADRSYGIHVARLAGVPRPVLERAQVILDRLERDPFGEAQVEVSQPKKHRRVYHQLSLFPMTTAHPVLDEVRMVDLETASPEEMKAQLLRWKEQLLRESET